MYNYPTASEFEKSIWLMGKTGAMRTHRTNILVQWMSSLNLFESSKRGLVGSGWVRFIWWVVVQRVCSSTTLFVWRVCSFDEFGLTRLDSTSSRNIKKTFIIILAVWSKESNPQKSHLSGWVKKYLFSLGSKILLLEPFLLWVRSMLGSGQMGTL